MKHTLLMLLVLVAATASAQIVTFSDPNFKAKLLTSSSSTSVAYNSSEEYIKIDANNDGQIQVAEALLVYKLNVSGASLTAPNSITNLSGIEAFANLTELTCNYQKITSLDATALTNLTRLYCDQTYVTSINVTGLNSLVHISCGYNEQLQVMDCSNLPQLQTILCSSGNLTSLLLNGSTLLKEIYCLSSELTTLDLTGLTQLEVLNIQGNALTALDASPATALILLNCINNTNLTNLTVTGLTNLEILQCSNNNLSSLPLQGLSSLKTLFCDNNSISAIDLSQLPQLKYFNCADNNLSSLDISANIQLTRLQSQNNNLTTLDILGFPMLDYIDCSHNSLETITLPYSSGNGYYKLDYNLLQSIFMKNGDSDLVDFSNNPTLQYLCTDEEELAQTKVKINDFGYTAEVNSYCTFTPGGTFYTIQGTHQFDLTGNGCDNSDLPMTNLKLSITNGTVTGNIISDESGAYTIAVQAGTHILKPVFENAGYFTASPATFNVSFPTAISPFTKNICITANGVHPDLEVIIVPMTAATAGFDATYKIIYKNKGTNAQSGAVALAFEDAVLDYVTSNPVYSALAINTVSWDFTNLAPFETREINVTFNLNGPMDTPPLNSDDIYQLTATVSSAATDETPLDNVFMLSQIVANSFDPNDKTCLEGNTITPDMVGKYVHYLIRFENLGTAPAQNIIVNDIIDTTKFDLSSLVALNSSHAYTTRITAPNKVDFMFQGINLPFDDANNDGYLLFKIKTKPTLVIGNTFSNTASIYFDYNFPVVTDPAVTTVQVLGISETTSGTFAIYPNPTSGMLSILSKDKSDATSVSVYNVLGQMVQALKGSSIETIDVSRLNAGTYFIKIQSDKGSATSKFIKK